MNFITSLVLAGLVGGCNKAPSMGNDAGTDGALPSGVCKLPDIVSTETPFDLRVRGSGMDAHDGKTVRVIAYPPTGNGFGIAEEQVANGTFDVLFSATSLSYTTVAVYIDTDGNNTCDSSEESNGEITTGVTVGSDTTVIVHGGPCLDCSSCLIEDACYQLLLLDGPGGACLANGSDLGVPLPCP